MAEIKIERKERSPWPWVIGALALAALVVLLIGVLGDDDDELQRAELDTAAPVVETGAVAVGAAVAIPEVEQFTQWVAGMNPAEFGRNHEYTASGIMALTEAFAAVAERDTVGGQAVDPALERARAVANDIQTDPTAASHADRVQNGFSTLTDLAAALQQTRFPGAEAAVNDMRNAAGTVNPATPLLEQTDAVQQFFRAAAEALGDMSNPV